MDNYLLTVKNGKKIYHTGNKEYEAIKNINFSVEKGEFISIIGPSGCGKTTLLEVLAGLRKLTSGSVQIKGETINKPHSAIGIVFQEDSTFPWKTTLENVMFGLLMQGVNKKKSAERALKMIGLVGLNGFENSYPHELSGGMRQRVAIARTLVTNPEIVVMDEPFGALDEQTRLILGGELINIVNKTKATVVLVTHSIQEAALLSDRVIVLSSRPGMIKKIIPNEMDKPRSAKSLTTNKFQKMSQKLWASLEEDALIGRSQQEKEIKNRE